MVECSRLHCGVASNTVCYECVLPIIKTNMARTSFYGEAEINEGRNQNNQNVDTLDKMSLWVRQDNKISTLGPSVSATSGEQEQTSESRKQNCTH